MSIIYENYKISYTIHRRIKEMKMQSSLSILFKLFLVKFSFLKRKRERTRERERERDFGENKLYVQRLYTQKL